jgi:hypothetical protein
MTILIALFLLTAWALVAAVVASGLGALFLLSLIVWVARQGWQPRLSAAEMRRMYPERTF